MRGCVESVVWLTADEFQLRYGSLQRTGRTLSTVEVDESGFPNAVRTKSSVMYNDVQVWDVF